MSQVLWLAENARADESTNSNGARKHHLPVWRKHCWRRWRGYTGLFLRSIHRATGGVSRGHAGVKRLTFILCRDERNRAHSGLRKGLSCWESDDTFHLYNCTETISLILCCGSAQGAGGLNSCNAFWLFTSLESLLCISQLGLVHIFIRQVTHEGSRLPYYI